MLAQKQSDQTIVKLVERLKSQGYEVRPNAARRGRSGVDHTFDYVVARRDGFTNLLAAIEVINDAEDPETSLHRLFAFQDKCSECGIGRSVVIALPRLSFVASQFAQKDGVEVFDEQALQMFLARAPAARASPSAVPSTFMQKSEVHQSLKTLGYRVDETVRVVGSSGTEHVFGAMALWDDGFILSRLGMDYLYGDSVDRTDVSLFDDKCRDAGIMERMLLIPKGLTEEAKKLAQEKRIEVISLDGRPREVVPEGIDPAPALSQQPGSNGGKPGSPGAPRLPEAAARPPVPPAAAPGSEAKPTAPDKPSERKKTIVVSEVKPITPATPGREGSPAPDKAAPATAQAGGSTVFAPMEPPQRSKPFSMRSVFDQFLAPQVKPKPAEKGPAPAGAAAVSPAAPGKDVSRPPPVPEKQGGAETKPPAAKPGAFVAKPAVLPQAKPAEAKAVLVAERPDAPQAKAEAKPPDDAAAKAAEAPKGTAEPPKAAAEAPKVAAEAPKVAAEAKAAEAPKGAAEPPKAAAEAPKTAAPKTAAPKVPEDKAAAAKAPDDAAAKAAR